jgi:hypothetical protein
MIVRRLNIGQVVSGPVLPVLLLLWLRLPLCGWLVLHLFLELHLFLANILHATSADSLTFVIFDKLLVALLLHPPLPSPLPPRLLVPLSLPLLLIFFAPFPNRFLHLIVFPCPLLSCSPLLIYDELYRPSFVPVLMKDIYIDGDIIVDVL